jgi:tetratricopeptide (TPR) repeat protein
MRRRIVAALLLAAAAGAGGASQAALEQLRAQRDPGWKLTYLPSGKYLKVASLGFAPLLADLIYLWSIQYYGSFHGSVRYDMVEHVYVDVVGQLDPGYLEAYTLAALILTVEARAPERALKVLETGMERNPDNWVLPFEAGFIAFNSLRDYERAQRYYERSAAMPSAHPTARRFAAEMFNKLGDKRTAYQKWVEIYESAEDDFVRDVAYSHVHDLKIEIDLETLRGALGEFRRKRGAWPQSLTGLVAAGLIPQVPVDPDGAAYAYDAGRGEVRTQSPYRLRRR